MKQVHMIKYTIAYCIQFYKKKTFLANTVLTLTNRKKQYTKVIITNLKMQTKLYIFLCGFKL